MKLAEVLADVSTSSETDDVDDVSRELLDAALLEASAVGLRRLTVEEVVRRAGVARMTAYRRYPKRDDLIRALVLREMRRFLAAVAAGVAGAERPEEIVAEAFVAAVAFARTHPGLRRVPETDTGGFIEAVAADGGRIFEMGVGFIAAQVAALRPDMPAQQVRWVADTCGRLFITYVAIPPTDPDAGSEDELRRFANRILTPLIER